MNYATTAAKILKTITSAGCAMTIVKKTIGVFNPTSGKKDSSLPVSIACVGIIDSYDVFMTDGTSVLSDDQRIYIPAAGISQPPASGDKITSWAGSWNIISVKTIGPGGVPLIYDIQVRQ